eukprot:15446353-Alexandrium_andersonii.AAC.1
MGLAAALARTGLGSALPTCSCTLQCRGALPLPPAVAAAPARRCPPAAPPTGLAAALVRAWPGSALPC